MSELPSPYGNCEPSFNYEQSKCLAHCKANYVIGKCNCRDVYMPGEKCSMHDSFKGSVLHALSHVMRPSLS